MARGRTLLDLLCTRYPDREREALLSLILCGEIVAGGSVIKDPKLQLPLDVGIEIRRKRFVSRGGEKLEHALTYFSMDVTGLVCLDAGASTGGFTDCLLQRGANLVHAVDVGSNQLDYRLRTDARVLVRERTSILAVDHLEPRPELAVADLSFRSLAGAAAHLLDLTTLAEAIVLIKPQFEWLDPPPEFDGTVPADDAPGIVSVAVERLRGEDVIVVDICESPITGREGNREFLARVTLRSSGKGDGLRSSEILSRLQATS